MNEGWSEESLVAELEAVEIFEPLDAAAKQALASSAEVVRVPAGATVFEEGDVADAVFVVRSGMVRIARAAEPDVTLMLLPPTGAFGELGVLNGAPRAASAFAVDDCELLRLDAKAVEVVLEDPAAARRMLGRLATSLTLTREQVVKQNRELDIRVRERTEELRETQLEVIRRLGMAAEFRDDDTGVHITRMSRFCAELAHEAGIDEAGCELLLHAAPMHDIGKIGIPDSILLKPGKLDAEEFSIMKQHTLIGADLLAGSDAPVMTMAREIALSHHERWDGQGYPRKLAQTDIPFFARICSICDVFDALISSRPYKEPWPPEEALGLIEREAGAAFDPYLAELFLRMSDRVLVIYENFRTVRLG